MSDISRPPQGPQPHEELHQLTPEQFNEGYTLAPDETISFDASVPPKSAFRTYQLADGMSLQGTAVAEMRIGGDNEFVTAYIINQNDGIHADDPKDLFLALYPGHTGRPVAMKLKQGELWGIGRGFEGQEHFPAPVSRDHCAVGLDDAYQVVIENHQPTNHTAVRALGAPRR